MVSYLDMWSISSLHQSPLILFGKTEHSLHGLELGRDLSATLSFYCYFVSPVLSFTTAPQLLHTWRLSIQKLIVLPMPKNTIMHTSLLIKLTYMIIQVQVSIVICKLKLWMSILLNHKLRKIKLMDIKRDHFILLFWNASVLLKRKINSWQTRNIRTPVILVQMMLQYARLITLT